MKTLLIKFASRKFLAFAVGTGLFITGTLDQQYWIALAFMYVGAQGVHDIVERMKGVPQIS